MVLPSSYPYWFAALNDSNVVWEAETDKNLLFEFFGFFNMFVFYPFQLLQLTHCAVPGI